MRELFLTAKDQAQERIKAYLEENASEELAYKINVGAPIERDGTQLWNRKTLDGFMKYATEEAQKTVKSGARCACIDDQTVFGWAVHYFQEDEITERLYNQNGTEYTPKKTEKATPTEKPKKAPVRPDKTAPKQTPTPKPKDEPKQAQTPPQTPKQEPKPKKQKAQEEPDPQISIFDMF